ncbi:MAG: hypothetical protein MR861_04125 [Clostridiales bacterium]|nr:hypothetical protein [Clostridiales bacterium]
MKRLRHCPEREFAPLDVLRKCFDYALFIQRIAGQTAQTVKVPSHRLRRSRVPIIVQRFFGCANGGLEQQRRQLCPLKDRNNAFFRRTLSLTVAASRRLHDGIQSCQFPVYSGKIHINPRLYQRSGYYTARFAPPQSFSDLTKQRLTLGWNHQRGQVIATLRRQQRVYTLGRLAAVDNAEDLPLLAQLLRQRLVGQHSDLLKGHATEAVIQRRRLWAKLRHGTVWRIGMQQVV